MTGRISLDKLAAAADRKSSEENYWLNKFHGEFKKSHFPYDIVKPGPRASAPASIRFNVSGTVFSRLLALSNDSDVRLYVVLVSAAALLLFKYTGDPDITLGAPIYKQEKDADFINTVLALKNRVERDLTFKELLLQVGQTLFEAVENQNYPIETLLYQLDIPFSREEDFPLFDIVVLLENIHERDYIRRIHTNITLSFLRSEQEINAELSYDPGRYKKETMTQIARHFGQLLENALSDIAAPLKDIDILSNEEKEQLLCRDNDTVVPLPGQTGIHNLFEKQAAEKPGNIALIHGQQRLTYGELNEQANRLAHFLIGKGVGPESVVGILAERSPEILTAILGILKAGGAYLPISPGLPAARKRFMLQDSGAEHLLMQKHLFEENREVVQAASLPAENVCFLDDPAIYPEERAHNPGVAVAPINPGYIIYTSGSTGLPKGVILAHRGIVNYIGWAAQQYVNDEGRGSFPFYTSFSFDLTVTSIFIPLVTGNTVVIYSGDDREFLIQRVLEDDKVDIVKLTPAHLRLLRDNETGKGGGRIKSFILGGENLEAQLAADIHRAFAGSIEIYNEYGPTETVVGSMIHRFDPGQDRGESVPIGRAINNTRVYLLDEDKQPVPLGVAGELFISGAGVARGYLNRPELTAQTFCSDPFVPGQGMYKSGDLARRSLDGKVAFLGRKDQQVKIHGYRIELGEIESKIRSFNKNRAAPVKPLQQLAADAPVVRCSACLLPDNYPGIDFDDSGVCSICREYRGNKEHVERYFKEPETFQRLVAEQQKSKTKPGHYDCLLLFSGGKDSSYVLFRLVEMGLRVLTFTFDNGYISDAAFKNIKRITEMLEVDNLVGRAEFMNRVFVESLRANNNVCHGCWNALNSLAIKVAHEQGINLVISGLSRGQIYDMRLEGLIQAGIFAEDEIEEKLLLFRKSFHSRDNRFFRLLGIELDNVDIDNIQFVDFFRYYDTPVPEIKKYLVQRGWVQPQDTGFCSSNCLINDVGIYMHLQERGYHSYAAPLSWDIRLGQLARASGIEEMSVPQDTAEVQRILTEIGYYRPVTVTDAVVLDRGDEKGNHFLCAYIVTDTGVSLDLPALKAHLANELPDYMIPAHFVQLDKIPLTSGGKVDKQGLLEAGGTLLEAHVSYVAPGDEEEIAMAELCQEIFGLDRIGINDNFFNHGATSFTIIQLNSKLQETFKQDIPVLALFEYPTIASFLEHLNSDTQVEETRSSREEDDWLASRKEGRDKFKQLRNRRKTGETND